MKKIIIYSIFAVLFVAPIALLLLISSKEMASYENFNEITFNEKAYGTAVTPTRKTINETVDVTGTYEYSEVYFQNLDEYDYEDLYINVEIGDEILMGDTIGTYKNEKINSVFTGLIIEINMEKGKTYIKYASFENLRYKTFVPINVDIQKEKTYSTYEGVNLKAYSVSNVYIDNKREVVFTSDTENLLNEVKSYKLNSGKVYENVLVLEKSCIYQNEITGKSQVRIIDNMGNVLETREITAIGDFDDTFAIITGVDETEYCDNGFGAFLGAYS